MIFFTLVIIVKHVKKNLYIMKPLYSEQILPASPFSLRYIEVPLYFTSHGCRLLAIFINFTNAPP